MKPTHDEEVEPLCSRAREHNRTTCTNTVRVGNASPVPHVTLCSRAHQGLLDLVPVYEKVQASNQHGTNTNGILLEITCFFLNYNIKPLFEFYKFINQMSNEFILILVQR